MEGALDIYQYLSATKPKLFGMLTLIGVLVVLSKIFKAIKAIYKATLRPSKNLIKRYGQDTWALITGSSDGIGRQFALSLAKRGFNIIISARTKSKLEKVADQIKALNPKAQVKIIITDFTKCHQPGFFNEFMKQIQTLDISMLVNNVGLEFICPYHEVEEQKIQDLATVNTLPISILSHRFIQRFLKRSKRSAIINLGSMAAETPLSGYHVYTASKAFDDFLGRSLSYDYPKIDIMTLRPSEVSTPMTSNKPLDIFTISPETCVEGTLRDLGWEKETNGAINHKIQSWLISLVSQGMYNKIFSKLILPGFIDERKKLAEAQKKKL